MTTVLWSGDSQTDAKQYIEENATSTDLAGLNGALNDAFSDRGKNSGNHVVTGYGTVHILHASAGSRGSGRSTTVFYFFHGGNFHLIALGEHDGSAYKIDRGLGQDEMPFQKNKRVSATGQG